MASSCSVKGSCLSAGLSWLNQLRARAARERRRARFSGLHAARAFRGWPRRGPAPGRRAAQAARSGRPSAGRGAHRRRQLLPLRRGLPPRACCKPAGVASAPRARAAPHAAPPRRPCLGNQRPVARALRLNQLLQQRVLLRRSVKQPQSVGPHAERAARRASARPPAATAPRRQQCAARLGGPGDARARVHAVRRHQCACKVKCRRAWRAGRLPAPPAGASARRRDAAAALPGGGSAASGGRLGPPPAFRPASSALEASILLVKMRRACRLMRAQRERCQQPGLPLARARSFAAPRARDGRRKLCAKDDGSRRPPAVLASHGGGARSQPPPHSAAQRCSLRAQRAAPPVERRCGGARHNAHVWWGGGSPRPTAAGGAGSRRRATQR